MWFLTVADMLVRTESCGVSLCLVLYVFVLYVCAVSHYVCVCVCSMPIFEQIFAMSRPNMGQMSLLFLLVMSDLQNENLWDSRDYGSSVLLHMSILTPQTWQAHSAYEN